MKTYDKKMTQPEEVLKDFLLEKGIQIGRCKYSDVMLSKHEDGLWKKHNSFINNQYVKFNHWNINLQYDVKMKGTEEMVTIVKTNIKIQDDTGFTLNKSTWSSLLDIISQENIVDTSMDLYRSIVADFNKTELDSLTETNKFIDLFTSVCKGDLDFNKQKMRVLLNTYVRRSLGNKTDYVAVFKSLEGSGKSDFITNELLGTFHKNNLINPNAKLTDNDWTFKDYFADNCAMFIEEQGIGEKAHEAFKNYTSMLDFQIQPKNQTVMLNKISRAMMFFSTNKNEFIYGDDKINRRFIIFDLADNKMWNEDDNGEFPSIFKDINWEKLWSEQFYHYKKGTKYNLDWGKLAIENKASVVKTSFRNKDNYILDILANEIIDQENGVEHWITGVDVQVIIHELHGESIQFSNKDNNEVCKTLKKLGLDYKKRKCDLNLPSIELGFDKYYDNKFVFRNKVKISQQTLNSLGLAQPESTALGLPL
jgi:hypothetical protein